MGIMIHITLDYFLRLSDEVFKTSPKRHIGTCVIFNTFVDTFKQKLLMVLDDVEQFFLGIVAAMLDGRRTSFEWVNPMWDRSMNGGTSPTSTKIYTI